MRNTEIFTITTEGRDYGKQFLITEMSAWDAEKLAHELLRFLVRGQHIPDEIVEMGCKGLATIGSSVFTLTTGNEAETLSNKLLSTVKRILPDAKMGMSNERPIVAEDISEWQTLIDIKDRVFKLNFGFLVKEAK